MEKVYCPVFGAFTVAGRCSQARKTRDLLVKSKKIRATEQPTFRKQQQTQCARIQVCDLPGVRCTGHQLVLESLQKPHCGGYMVRGKEEGDNQLHRTWDLGPDIYIAV